MNLAYGGMSVGFVRTRLKSGAKRSRRVDALSAKYIPWKTRLFQGLMFSRSEDFKIHKLN